MLKFGAVGRRHRDRGGGRSWRFAHSRTTRRGWWSSLPATSCPLSSLPLVLRAGMPDRRRVRHLGRLRHGGDRRRWPPSSSATRSPRRSSLGIGLDHHRSAVGRIRFAPGRMDRAPSSRTVMWLALAGAILIEVVGDAVHAGFGRLPQEDLAHPGRASAISRRSRCCRLSLSLGMPVGIAYGVWSACGVALVAVIAKFLFGEPLTPMMVLGIALHHRRGADHRVHRRGALNRRPQHLR